METINHLYENLEKEKATLHDNLSYFFSSMGRKLPLLILVLNGAEHNYQIQIKQPFRSQIFYLQHLFVKSAKLKLCELLSQFDKDILHNKVMLKLAYLLPKYILADLPLQRDVVRHWVKYLLFILTVLIQEQLQQESVAKFLHAPCQPGFSMAALCALLLIKKK